MTNQEWFQAKDELLREITALGFPAELGELIARQLGSQKAIRRMSSYLRQVRPRKAEEVVDEMLAISSEIEAWPTHATMNICKTVGTNKMNSTKNGRGEYDLCHCNSCNGILQYGQVLRPGRRLLYG